MCLAIKVDMKLPLPSRNLSQEKATKKHQASQKMKKWHLRRSRLKKGGGCIKCVVSKFEAISHRSKFIQMNALDC